MIRYVTPRSLDKSGYGQKKNGTPTSTFFLQHATIWGRLTQQLAIISHHTKLQLYFAMSIVVYCIIMAVS